MALHAVDGRLDLQHVLAGLQQQQVGAAFAEAAGLFAKQVGQLLPCDVAEVGVVAAGQLAGGPHAAGDEARHAGSLFVLVAGATRQAGGGAVNLQRALAEAVFAEGEAVAAEGVGLDDLATDGEEGLVDGLDHVGAGDGEVVDAAVVAFPAEVGGDGIARLDAGAHGAVEEDDVVGDGVEVTPVGEAALRPVHGVFQTRNICSFMHFQNWFSTTIRCQSVSARREKWCRFPATHCTQSS